ncbi:hypothetical protein GCM10009716_11500 [Streptomyces sodiiphilus]|uniref:Uncharacterized protein n=1 Tax=Streptomyces sodiiphilus TaxID=226217 RepID=A0ABP5A6K9_9ACTN
MTHRPRPRGRNETPARRLARHHESFLAELGGLLDIEAGLRDVLLQSRHDSFTDDLAGHLDIEAGLSAVLPAPSIPAEDLPGPPDPAALASLPDSADVTRFLLSVSSHDRITLRRHPGVLAACRLREHARHLEHTLLLAYARSRDLTRTLDNARYQRVRELVRTLATDLDLGLARSRGFDPEEVLGLVGEYGLALARALRSELVRDLSQAHARALALDRDVDLDFARTLTRTLTRDLGQARDRARSMGRVCSTEVRLAIGAALGQPLPDLDDSTVTTFLDDFTSSDLRDTDLTGVSLEGVRWSETGTRWPDGTDVEDLKSRSEEAADERGVLVIRSGTATVRDLAGLF